MLNHIPQILDLVQQASNYKQLKKGANEGNLLLQVPLFDQEFFWLTTLSGM